MSEYTSNQLKKIIDETTTAWSIPVVIAGGLYQFRYHQTRVGKVRERPDIPHQEQHHLK